MLPKLRFPNPRFEMRLLTEGWCLGSRSLWITGIGDDGSVTIESRAGDDSSRLLAAHAARLDREFFADTWKSSRGEFLAEHGDAADRPVTDAPAPWHHVRSLDQARRRARDQQAPLLIQLTYASCPWCRLMSWTLQDAEVDALLRATVRVELVIDPDTSDAMAALGVKGVPASLPFGADNRELGRLQGCVGPGRYAAWLAPHVERPR